MTHLCTPPLILVLTIIKVISATSLNTVCRTALCQRRRQMSAITCPQHCGDATKGTSMPVLES